MQDYVRIALDIILLVATCGLFLLALFQVLTEKGREQGIIMWLLFAFGLVLFGYAVTFNLIGDNSCKTKSFYDFLLFRTRNFCSSRLAFSYALIFPVLIVVVGKWAKLLYQKTTCLNHSRKRGNG